ncbi:small oligopeptide transporter, OPT family [Aspergillus homomorphus CBS 101889]|uniref:Small oligopeptide transporter, OPT family n=1 Tax=Aspergillus homomorphus (strain CBS 101889) TaxID=1450537 RepID=A0A395I004_ASPHC|nr:small oligopeptide transporter, OPT family [Aspergillus homomorphus CBS 101889]RAL13267.1 small oligopeptide transporter, OPT family [Aspergillus homomorphus CBS 101889]
MTQPQSETLHSADVEIYAAGLVPSDDGMSKKPLNSADALEIAIGESSTVEYTIDSDNSPYLEVRANVPNTDDPTLPINTFRMRFLGVVFTLIGTGVNQFFSMRYPSVTITSLVAQLITYPVGCAFAKALPIMKYKIGRWELDINPDHHFNIKEHAVITTMSNLSLNQSWASAIIQAQKVYLNMSTPVGYQILLSLTMQLFGLGLAGLTYRYIIWPSTLANAALFQTLHSGANPLANSWKISRYRFFMYACIGSFCWYWFPGYIFTGLSTFAFFAGRLLSQIAYYTSPLVIPFWAQVNVFAGWFFVSDAYDNTGNLYNSSRILDKTGTIVEGKYKAYSPIFLPVTFSLSYGVGFAVLSCLITHVLLYHTKDIVSTFKGQSKKDVHARLLSRYPDVPWWWYAVLTVRCHRGLAIMTQYVWHTGLPFWGLFITLALAIIYVTLVGTVYAVANLNSNCLTVLGEIVSEYLLKGKPLVLLVFKFHAYTGLSQAMYYAADMKLGLYMNIPGRTLFVVQLVACILGTLTQHGVLLWMLGHVKDVCSEDQPDNFTCPQGRVNYNSAVFWGAIGPARLYNLGQMYSGLLHFFWLGRPPPDPHLPRPQTLPQFQLIKTRRPHWWAKYNYVLSAALDSGVAVSAIVIFFALTLPGFTFSWWGNNVNSGTVDSRGTPWLELRANETFGPRSWA